MKLTRVLKGDSIFSIVNYSLLSLLLIIYIYPLVYIISSSFSSVEAVTTGQVVLFPVDFSLEGYKNILSTSTIWDGYWNSIVYTVVGTAINIIITIMAAYPLSRKDFIGKGPIMLVFTFTMIFSGGLIPTYLVVSNLKLLNTLWAMVLPGAMSIYFMIIARTFFQSNIPLELQEAAEIEGCNDMQLIWQIILPLSKSIIAVLILFYAIIHWNSFFDALLYLKSNDKFPLPIVLREILIRNQSDGSMLSAVAQERVDGMKELIKYGLIVVSSLPVLCIYPFVQRHFVKGIMIGSVKG